MTVPKQDEKDAICFLAFYISSEGPPAFYVLGPNLPTSDFGHESLERFASNVATAIGGAGTCHMQPPYAEYLIIKDDQVKVSGGSAGLRIAEDVAKSKKIEGYLNSNNRAKDALLNLSPLIRWRTVQQIIIPL